MVNAASGPGTITGTGGAVSVLGGSASGEAGLTYTWSVVSAPAGGSASFSPNGSNGAKNAAITVTRAGAYVVQVAIVNTANGTATISGPVTITVTATLTALAVSGPTAVAVGDTAQFSAATVDQFQQAMASQPALTWTATGGAVDASGVYHRRRHHRQLPGGGGGRRAERRAGGQRGRGRRWRRWRRIVVGEMRLGRRSGGDGAGSAAGRTAAPAARRARRLMAGGDRPADGARSAFQQDRVIAELRGAIIAGTLAPGSRLPTRRELQRRFDVASLTLQRALDRLAADGFIATRANRGTFVVDHPPHASHYGLVVPVPHGPTPVRFWTALVNEAHALSGAPGGSGGSASTTASTAAHGGATSQRLVRDLGHARLAGLIFAVNPFALAQTPVLTPSRVCRASRSWIRRRPRWRRCGFDSDSFIDKACDHFRARRRTRVAVLTVPGQGWRPYQKRAAVRRAGRALAGDAAVLVAHHRVRGRRPARRASPTC